MAEENVSNLSAEDLADRIWNMIAIVGKSTLDTTIQQLRTLVLQVSPATAARAFDRLRVATQTIAFLRDKDERVLRDVYQYTKTTHGIFWDVYKLLIGAPGLARGAGRLLRPGRASPLRRGG